VLNVIDAIVPQRYWAWAACAILAVACLAMAPVSMLWYWPSGLFAVLAFVGLVDFAQPKQAIRRNYPVIAHFRFFFEFIRPEIRQYFIEADNEHLPFSRTQRSIVYQRSKGVVDKRPFGTQLDVY
jgi:glutamate synthase domain-containing protein 2